MKLRNIRIGTRLAFGFGIVIGLTLILGVTSINKMLRLSELTEQIYHHSLSVSNAIRDINLNINELQNSAKNLMLSAQPAEYKEITVNDEFYYQQIEKALTLVEQRYNGNFATVEKIRFSLKEWRKQRDSLVVYMKCDKFQAAKTCMKAMEMKMLKELAPTFLLISDFTKEQSKKIFENAGAEKQLVIRWMLLLLTVIVSSGLLVAYSITQSIILPIKRLIPIASSISKGRAIQKQPEKYHDEIGKLISSFNLIIETSNNMMQQAKTISSGDYSFEITPRSQFDELSIALREMTNSLLKSKKMQEELDWTKTGLNELNQKLRGDQELNDFAQNVISFLAQYLNAQVAALYISDPETHILIPTASFALGQKSNTLHEFHLGEGLIGQAAVEKKMISVHDIPSDYLKIESALGSTSPKNIVIQPLIYRNSVCGIIELGLLENLQPLKINFLTHVAENIAIGIASAQSRSKMTTLLEQTKQQAEKLQIQQEKLLKTNEELENQTIALEESQAELRSQQEELRATNEILLEKNAELENARAEIEKKAIQLEQSGRYKSEFLANMSHEIRTPMNAIIGFSEILKERLASSPQFIEYIEGIINSGNSLLQLINDILDLSKIEAGKLDIHYETINIESVINELRHIFSIKINEKKLNFTINIEPNIPKAILLDEVRIRQILFNLIGNAIKFTPAGKIVVSVKILTREINEDKKIDLIIDVTDTGIGIPADQQEIIFEPFTQQEGQNNRKYGGTGLGLTISRRLAQMMNGKLTLKSEVNKGSTFSVMFENVSVACTYECEISPFTAPQYKIIFERATVLLVEDIESNRKVVKGYLETENLKLVEAEDGKKAITQTKKYKPDLILMDMQMPIMDGYTATRLIKADEEIKHIPIIALTASAMKEEVSKIQDICDDYLRKPITKAALVEKMANYLKHTKKISEKKEEQFDYLKVTDAFSKQNNINFVKLSKCVNNKIIPLYENVKQTSSLLEIKQLAEQIKQIGNEYDFSAFKQYGNELKTFAETYQFNKIMASFTVLDQIIELLLNTKQVQN